MKHYVLAAVLVSALAAPATAYTTFVLPADFDTAENSVTVQASHASQFFTPSIAVPADFDLVMPDGGPGTFGRVEVAGAATTMNANLPQWGTYRITSGEQVGPVSTLVGVDGGWRPLAQGETPPEGAPVTTIQTVTLSDTYVSRGEPTTDVLAQPSGTLAIRPLTHPNQVLVSTGMEVELLFNGAPFANTAIVLYDEGDADTNVETFAATDANGRARFSFTRPGNYVIAARHRGAAPAGSQAQVRSYTTTLTFAVMEALPTYAEPPEQERPRRRRDSGLGFGR